MSDHLPSEPTPYDDDPFAPSVLPAEVLRTMATVHVSQARIDQFDAQLRAARGCVAFLAVHGYEMLSQAIGRARADLIVQALATVHFGAAILAEAREAHDDLLEKQAELNDAKDKARRAMEESDAEEEDRKREAGDFDPPGNWNPESDDHA